MRRDRPWSVKALLLSNVKTIEARGLDIRRSHASKMKFYDPCSLCYQSLISIHLPIEVESLLSNIVKFSNSIIASVFPYTWSVSSRFYDNVSYVLLADESCLCLSQLLQWIYCCDQWLDFAALNVGNHITKDMKWNNSGSHQREVP